MSAPLLTTKLYIPKPRPDAIIRPRLIERMNDGLRRRLTLIAAPAGFGKTTLASEWLQSCDYAAAWLSLEAGDNDPQRFLSYLIAALQTIEASVGGGVLRVLQSPQATPIETLLTVLINDLATISHQFVLVLDDFHVIDDGGVNQAVAFLLENMPSQMHLVIVTREDPSLPLARLRARAALTELRATDLRFTTQEAAGFLSQTMGLELSHADIEALEQRTEGWIVGLQLAALSLQGQSDAHSFIASFTGSHRFILDYLTEEVVVRLPEDVQLFLLHTSFLERLCGPLCDAVLGDATAGGQATLEYLEQANLFIIPLDNERRWYRYHHLFADLLRQRLQHALALQSGDVSQRVAELHLRASEWYEHHGFDLEAFHHAVAANAIDRAARLVEGRGMPLPFRGAAVAVMNWLVALPPATLDQYPALWVIYASVLLLVGDLRGVEEKLGAAEAILDETSTDPKIRDLIGHIAAVRATLAVTKHQVPTIIAQSRRALDFLHPDNLPVRTSTIWALGYAHQLQGDRIAAQQAYSEATAISTTIGHQVIMILATLGVGHIQTVNLQFHLAVETYQGTLRLIGDAPLALGCVAHLGLARIFYEWNDLAVSQNHAQQALVLARQLPTTDRFVLCEVMLARLALAQGDVVGATTLLTQANHAAQQQSFNERIPEIAEQQLRIALRQADQAAAVRLVQSCNLPVLVARLQLASGESSEALATIAPALHEAEARQWVDERLKLLILQALAFHQGGDRAKALQALGAALDLAAPSGLIRSFVDEGQPMAALLSAAKEQVGFPDTSALLALLEPQQHPYSTIQPRSSIAAASLIEPLSQREQEILNLIAQGLSNQEICERLFLSLSTVKGHNRNIFDKLQVQRRTEAVARARELGLL